MAMAKRHVLGGVNNVLALTSSLLVRQLVGEFGLSAGKIYINGQFLSNMTETSTCHQSGICFEARFFLTVAQFYPFDQKCLNRMMAPGDGAAHLNNAVLEICTRYS